MNETKTVMYCARNTVTGKRNYFAVDNVASERDAFRFRQIWQNRANAQGLPFVYSWFLPAEETTEAPADADAAPADA